MLRDISVRPAVAVVFGTGGVFRSLIPGSAALTEKVIAAARSAWLTAGEGCSVIMLAPAMVAANSDEVVRNGES